MKTIFPILITAAMLARGICCADPPPTPKQSPSENSGALVRNPPPVAKLTASTGGGQRQTDEKQSPLPILDQDHSGEPAAAKSNLPPPFAGQRSIAIPSNHGVKTAVNDKNVLPLIRPVPAGNVGILQTKDNPLLLSRPTGLVPLGGPSLSNQRHAGPFPAMIGGPAMTKHSLAGTINGTGISRKP